LVYPDIEFYSGKYLYLLSYNNNWEESEDLSELEQEFCYNESYSYNKQRNISIIGWEYNGFLFFKWFKVEYEEGNICATEYLLEESYINHFLENAEIISNDDNVELSELIEDKKAIVGNKKYSLSDDHKYIEYMLDGEYEDMFISNSEDGTIIIQVGLTDEGPKYIAYK